MSSLSWFQLAACARACASLLSLDGLGLPGPLGGLVFAGPAGWRSGVMVVVVVPKLPAEHRLGWNLRNRKTIRLRLWLVGLGLQ